MPRNPSAFPVAVAPEMVPLASLFASHFQWWYGMHIQAEHDHFIPKRTETFGTRAFMENDCSCYINSSRLPESCWKFLSLKSYRLKATQPRSASLPPSLSFQPDGAWGTVFDPRWLGRFARGYLFVPSINIFFFFTSPLWFYPNDGLRPFYKDGSYTMAIPGKPDLINCGPTLFQNVARGSVII